MPADTHDPIRLEDLCRFKAQGRKFAMLTAYDFPTAAAAQAAGVHALLIGDSMGTVLLGHDTTRLVPLSLMLTLGEAVRRGAPRVYLIGDMPFEAMVAGDDASVHAARRFRDEAGCDAVKFEAAAGQEVLVEKIAGAGIEVMAHLGLRPQSVETPDGYRAQARDQAGIATLVQSARHMVDAGAVMILLEAVPAEASRAVLDAIDVPVVGCGAGPACDGHVVVTQDLLGIGSLRPPRFVPVYAQVGRDTQDAMRRYVEAISAGEYPAAAHVYPMRKSTAHAAR